MSSYNSTPNFDNLFLQSLLGKLQIRPQSSLQAPPFINQTLEDLLLDTINNLSGSEDDGDDEENGINGSKTQLSKEELKLEKEIIRTILGGKISIIELGSIFRAIGTVMSMEDLKRTMSEIDTDGDGFIDVKEFTEFHSGGDAVNGYKELREAFDLYDKDKNGVISAAELHSVLKSLGEKCSLKDYKKMNSSVDVDGDGCVNFEEFKKMMSRP